MTRSPNLRYFAQSTKRAEPLAFSMETFAKQIGGAPSGVSPDAPTFIQAPRRLLGVSYASGTSVGIFGGRKNLRVVGHPEGTLAQSSGNQESTLNIGIDGNIFQFAASQVIEKIGDNFNSILLDAWPTWAVMNAWVYVGYDTYDTDNEPTFGSGSWEQHATDSSDDGRRRIYGELIQIDSIDQAELTITFKSKLRWEYGLSGLRAYGATAKVNENITIENIKFVGKRWQTKSHLRILNTIGLTLKNITVDGADEAGINPVRCQDVTIEDCKTYRISSIPSTSGQGYGILPSMCHEVLIKNSYHWDCRYGVSLENGCTDLTVDNCCANFIYDAAIDVHGGDCRDLTFKNSCFPGAVLRVGNPSWRRGANNVLIQNVQALAINMVAAARNVTVENCDTAQGQIYNVENGDSGNGLMNSTGANKAYSQHVTFESCNLVNWSDAADRFPFSIQAVDNKDIRWSDLSFTYCTIAQYRATPSSGLPPLRAYTSPPETYGFGAGPNDVNFLQCIIIWKPQSGSGNNDNSLFFNRSAEVSGGVPPTIYCDNSTFVRSGTASMPKLIQVQSDASVTLNCCWYTNDSTTVMIANAGFVQGVTPTLTYDCIE